MNINSIHTNQVTQNASRLVDKSNSNVENRSGFSASQVSTGMSENEISTPQMQAQGITISVNYLQKQLDIILTHYPPFFPPGTYQRLDLIKKIKGIQEEVEKSAIDANLKKMFSGKMLSEDSTDKDISLALDKLFGLRDKLKQDNTESTDKAQPGSILNIKV